jgi:hypothetical protein
MDALKLYDLLFGLGLLALGFLLARYINNSDQNNKKQWEKIDNHETRVSVLETEHRIIRDSGGCFYLHTRKTDHAQKSNEETDDGRSD